MTQNDTPRLRPFDLGDVPKEVPQIVELHYDVWSLRLTLDFENWDGVVYVDFESPNGFRVLDESDLLETSQLSTSEEQWLYTVEKNGWLEQESRREGFETDQKEITEYFVAGINDCISVMTVEEPIATIIDGE